MTAGPVSQRMFLCFEFAPIADVHWPIQFAHEPPLTRSYAIPKGYAVI
jgi:hypothetical protein